MAKRVADQQLTKDGTMSDEDVITVGSQIGGPQKATAAQMAQRRYVKNFGVPGVVIGREGGCICLNDQNITRQQPSPTNFHLTLPQHKQTNSTQNTPFLYNTLEQSLLWATAPLQEL